jgi:hypothetical protein
LAEIHVDVLRWSSPSTWPREEDEGRKMRSGKRMQTWECVAPRGKKVHGRFV